jgi:NADH dehydrogenase
VDEKTEVVVVGGGYAGVMAANRLTKRDDVSVTLINPRPRFVERIRLHQLVGGTHPAEVDYAGLLAPGVRLVVDTAERVDVANRVVRTTGSGGIRYGYLIYAVGSGSAAAPEHAFPLASFEEARALRAAVDAAPAGAPLTVVGGGATGIETAAELAGRGRPVTLVCGPVLNTYLSESGRRKVASQLETLGVEVLAGVSVTAVEADQVRLSDGRTRPSAVTVWTAGFGVPDLATRSGLSTDTLGRLRTDETLTSIDSPFVIAAGDAVSPSDRPFRMSCQAAGPLGVHAAETVLRRIAGREPEAVAIGFVGQCLSLGRDAGLVQLSGRDDRAAGYHVGGRAGARIKEFVCWGTVRQLALEARRPGLFAVPSWMADRKRRELV